MQSTWISLKPLSISYDLNSQYIVKWNLTLKTIFVINDFKNDDVNANNNTP